MRFPSDGDMDDIVYPGNPKQAKGWAIAEFVQYAAKRLKPLGVRVSTDVFGLAATRELGVGQVPKRIGRYVDSMYPMVYPSHYNPGEYNLDDPNAAPAETVYYALVHFRRDLRNSKAELIPWLQDFSLRPHLRAHGGAGADRGGAPNRRPRLPALEPARRLHAGRAAPRVVARVAPACSSSASRCSAGPTTPRRSQLHSRP